MCGLFGFALPNADSIPEALVARGVRALQTLHHRGPDQTGYEVIGGVFMGHTRLAIIDLSEAGRQPMVTQDSQVAMTVNGEIYNHRVLRQEVGVHAFRSQSDSEVLLLGYRHFGLDKLLAKIDGMYAGVIYDHKLQRLMLFRDRVGIKPLYFSHAQIAHDDVFVWSSELKAIRAFLDNLQVDPTAVLDFAVQRCVPAPKSIYLGVNKLRPAHVAEYQLGADKFIERKYWQLQPSNNTAAFADLEDELHSLIDISVAEQLVADVPVGLFLSGGLDSSILCESASRLKPNINTYNISFTSTDRDESEFARIVADACGTHHVEENFTTEHAQQAFSTLNDWFDEPFGDLSALPTAMVSKLARGDSIVALSGDGGDELFGGYTWYQRYWRFRNVNKLIPSKKNLALPFYRPPKNIFEKVMNRFALLGQFDPLQLYTGITSNLLTSELSRVRQWLEIPADYDYVWALRPHYRPELGPRRSLQYLDFHTWLPDDILTKVDRVSMAVSLEVRVPFLKREICEFAFSLPDSFVYADNKLKGGLRRAYKNRLPDSILNRGKQGFSVPANDWREEVLDGAPNYVCYYLNKLRQLGVESAAR